MVLLVDKYRPKKLQDVFGNSETVTTLRSLIKGRNFPHLLFTGPPGTGKTTCAKIIASEIIQQDYRERVLELNASDERGIDVIRDRIKNFAKKAITADGICKIIILDEADSMTTAAQQALRRIMETSIETRFILICNSFSKIFEPIQSRCAVLRFDRLENHEIQNLLLKIAEKESIDIENAMDTIIMLSDGDMRQALNILQSCSFFEKVDEETILSVTGQPSPTLIAQINTYLTCGDLENALKIFDQMWEQKFDPMDIIQGFFRHAKNTDNYELLTCIGPYHLRISNGIGTKLQFYGLFHDIIQAYTAFSS